VAKRVLFTKFRWGLISVLGPLSLAHHWLRAFRFQISRASRNVRWQFQNCKWSFLPTQYCRKRSHDDRSTLLNNKTWLLFRELYGVLGHSNALTRWMRYVAPGWGGLAFSCRLPIYMWIYMVWLSRLHDASRR